MYEKKNPVTKYKGQDVKRYLKKIKGKWTIHPQTFAEAIGHSSAYVYKMIGQNTKIKKKLLGKIMEAFPDFVE